MRGHPPTTRRLLGRVFKRLSKPDVWFAGEGAFDARGKRTSGYNTEATRFSVYEAIVFESRHRHTSDQYWRSERIDSACTAIMRALSIREYLTLRMQLCVGADAGICSFLRCLRLLAWPSSYANN